MLYFLSCFFPSSCHLHWSRLSFICCTGLRYTSLFGHSGCLGGRTSYSCIPTAQSGTTTWRRRYCHSYKSVLLSSTGRIERSGQDGR